MRLIGLFPQDYLTVSGVHWYSRPYSTIDTKGSRDVNGNFLQLFLSGSANLCLMLSRSKAEDTPAASHAVGG